MENVRRITMETRIGRILAQMVLMLMISAAFVAAVPVNASAATITVPDDYGTIQAAIGAAIPGDTVYVRAGTYDEHVTIGKPLTLQGEDRNTTIIDGGGTGKVVTVTSTSNVNVSEFTIRNSGSLSGALPHDSGIVLQNASYCSISDCTMTLNGTNGLHLHRSSYNTIRNCDLYDNELPLIPGSHGAIHLRSSSRNTIEDNNIYSNGNDGITVRSGSNHTTITGNHVYSNGNYGIHLGWSHYCTIANNVVHDNRSVGVEFDAASYNTTRDNETYSNSAGIRIVFYARGNTFVGNVIRENRIGIQIGAYNLQTYSHTFYHNDIIDNTEQVRFGAYVVSNTWDNGYPDGGNYWSDYTGVDDDGDGIGDTPYVINAQNRDRYPLWIDSDGDGVLDRDDACPGTAAGDMVDTMGCSLDQYCPPNGEWKNHGQYVSCVAYWAEAWLDEGLISDEEKDAIVSETAQSDVGKKEK